MERVVQIRDCQGTREYLWLEGALVRVEDVRSLPREWRLRLLDASMERRGDFASMGVKSDSVHRKN